MSENGDDRARLTILGGFLGSGKTTWLRHQLRHGVFEDAFVIVNEAADAPVDDVLLETPRLAVLSGGCACCTKRDALIHVLRETLQGIQTEHDANSGPPRIVLETSGLADLGPIVDAVEADAVLSRRLVVSEVLVTVDACHGLALLAGEPLARRQIGAAHALIVTKLDRADPADVTTLLATLRLLNPNAYLFAATKGVEAAVPDFDTAIPLDLSLDDTEAQRMLVFATTLALGDDVDWTSFTVWLSSLLHARGNDVLRVKGVVRTPAGRLLIQTVRRLVQTPEILPDVGHGEPHDADNRLVVIGRGYQVEDLIRSMHRFVGKGVEPPPLG